MVISLYKSSWELLANKKLPVRPPKFYIYMCTKLGMAFSGRIDKKQKVIDRVEVYQE